MNEKIDIWPLRILILRLLESTGRLLISPVVLIFFIKLIGATNNKMYLGMIIVVSVVIIYVFFREIYEIEQAAALSIRKLIVKVNEPDLKVKNLSLLEFIVINAYEFKVFSISLEYLLNRLKAQGDIKKPKPNQSDYVKFQFYHLYVIILR